MPPLSYCAQEAYTHDRDRFYVSLFVPAQQRESLLAVYALNVELMRVRDAVKEEMIGHIRYAWWQESVEALYTGTLPRGQPVLEALVKVIADGYLPQGTLMPLLEAYRAHYPELPPGLDAVMETLSLALLRSLAPKAENAWRRANAVIQIHRRRYGKRRNGWLCFKLLRAGI